MSSRGQDFAQRVASTQARLASLGRLRATVGLPSTAEIEPEQWSAIQMGLASTQARLDSSLRRATREAMPRLDDVRVARRFNAHLGRIELEMAKAFSFFDMYADLLTQRHAGELGSLLRGC